MRIFVTGGTGLIGRRLIISRLERGDSIVLLSRDAGRATRLFAADVNPNIAIVEGDCTTPGRWQEEVDGCDGVVHLAGTNLFAKRWNDSFRKELADSRVDSTHQVVSAIESATSRPDVLVCASAVGYYGDTGENEIDETAPPGNDFLARLCVRWEEQANGAAEFGTRVVTMRTGVVLDPRGGALSELIKPFRFFIGGPIGTGRQYMPWIHFRDLINLYNVALINQRANGPLNGVGPNPVRNRELMAEIGAALGRPSWLPAPKFGLRIVLGEVAKFIAMSQRIVPTRALELGYHFVFPEIEPAIETLIADWESREDNGDQRKSIVRDVSTASIAAIGEEQQTQAMHQQIETKLRQKLERPIKKVRLLAIDVDGTLLRSDGRMARGVIDACRAAERHGCVIVPASARPPRTMRTILQELGTVGPSINYNGALIWNPVDDVSQYHEPLDAGIAREIVRVARECYAGVIIAIERLDRWFTDRIDPRNPVLADPDYIGDLDDVLTEPVTKLDLYGEPSRLQWVLSTVREQFGKRPVGRVSDPSSPGWETPPRQVGDPLYPRQVGDLPYQVAIYAPDPSLVQIMHPLADKGIALQRIARRLGAERSEVLAIGDGPNDAGMVEWAGFGVAVQNASEVVKSLADAIVPGNDDHGVARAIQRFVLTS